MSLKNSLPAARNIHARIASIASRAVMTDAMCVWALKTISAKRTVENKHVLVFFFFPANKRKIKFKLIAVSFLFYSIKITAN
ncbi:MAG: hypothetical protein HKO79_03740 [Desulfobacterales bacterium]|nr:hypothetical protein [Deltaproteobacteria bacterium]NNL41580.1 hypothetical protein [Desulfobacterales bacterium]